MIKIFKKLFIVNWLRINGSNLTKIFIYIALTIVLSYLYRRWETLLLVSHPRALLWLLIIYSMFLFVIFFRICLLLRQFILLRVPSRAVQAKKSFINKPNAIEEIGDVRLRPKLHKKDE